MGFLHMLVRGSISGLYPHPRFLWRLVLGLGFCEADEGRLDLTVSQAGFELIFFPRLDYRHTHSALLRFLVHTGWAEGLAQLVECFVPSM